jgi:hypothetical protein
MKKVFLIALLPLLCGLWACGKDDPLPPYTGPQPIDYTVLPPATQTGVGTFGCKVNGEVWVPRVELFVPEYDKSASLHEKNALGGGGISCRLLNTATNNFMSFGFGPTFFQPTTCYGGKSNPICSANFNISPGKWYSTFEADSLSNWVEITHIDTVQNIVSGKFNFYMKNDQNVNEIIKLTDGRFDLKYTPE